MTFRPFDLDNDRDYQIWRERKLEEYPENIESLIVEIGDPRRLTSAERDALLQRIRKCNMAIYASASGSDPDKEQVRALGSRFGLERLDNHMCADQDAISSLTVQSDALHQGYIPYTNRPIAWHTDGYYNDPDHQILGLLLHCVQPAGNGGANRLLDHEILYIWLRDDNPETINALMHPEAMTIPANITEGVEIRPPRTGPVFSVLPEGQLHMRYTDRTRSIEWRNDPSTDAAVEQLKKFLKRPSPFSFQGRLEPGQGLLCNNVLHTRTPFEDSGAKRLVYRARYFDRISGT
ncbi:MAG: TauD/TfdA family dioxygenase [Gammaproteobacteria bacterium]|nr:TauD/TfdA family dioxygenase [Gammaproteobacteria bacterium]